MLKPQDVVTVLRLLLRSQIETRLVISRTRISARLGSCLQHPVASRSSSTFFPALLYHAYISPWLSRVTSILAAAPSCQQLSSGTSSKGRRSAISPKRKNTFADNSAGRRRDLDVISPPSPPRPAAPAPFPILRKPFSPLMQPAMNRSIAFCPLPDSATPTLNQRMAS